MVDRLEAGMLEGRTFHVKVFGCQMNLSDGELVSGLLRSRGCVEVDEVEEAEILVVLTCCVREKADERMYGQVSSMRNDPAPAGSRSGRRIIALGGCIGQRDGAGVLERLPNVDVVFGTHNLDQLPALLEQAIGTGERTVELVEDAGPYGAEIPKARRSPFQAWLPIMKGCNNFCTYCIVPYVRGREMSRPIDEVVEEARLLVADGVREITLLGQNVNSYGRDLYGEPRFAEVLRRVGDTGIERLRFVTSHPKDLSDATIASMAEVPSVMPALHLPVQSGSDRVLAAMNRVYTSGYYLEVVDKLRAAIPGIALSTDVIVGFPGETEEDFEETCSIVERVGYTQAFTFIYSRRAGTPAAEMPDDTPREVIQRRFDRLVELVQDGAYRANQAELGTRVPVLVEGFSKRDDRMLAGRSPKNQTVHFPCPAGIEGRSLIGEIVDVDVEVAKTWYLSGAFHGKA